MGATNYNTTLLPAVERPRIIAAIEDALRQFGCHIVFRELPATYQEGFHYNSVNMVFFGPPGGRWVPLSTCSTDLGYEYPEGYRADPFSMALSKSLSPVVLLFSVNSGYVAGYSIFSEGRQVEAHTLCWDPEMPLREFAPPLDPPEPPTVLGGLLLDPNFDFKKFARGFGSLEVAMAALAPDSACASNCLKRLIFRMATAR